MKPAALLIVLLSHCGYWFGGNAGTASFEFPAPGKLPDSVLDWDVVWNGIHLAGGEGVAIKDSGAQVTIPTPAVRVPITARLLYRVRPRPGGLNPPANLGTGEALIRLYPRNIIGDFTRRAAGKTVSVVDSRDGLPKLLSAAKIDFRQVEDAQKLQMGRYDIALVGPDRIDDSPFAQSTLLSLARSGSSVMIFAQTRCRVLGGLRLFTLSAPRSLDWRSDHPLLAGLSADDLNASLLGRHGLANAMELVDQTAIEVASRHVEPGGESPGRDDAFVVTESMGRGRMILWQVPMDPWDESPISQIVLNNALGYLMDSRIGTPPESAIAPVEHHFKTVTIRELPGIAVPPGDERSSPSVTH